MSTTIHSPRREYLEYFIAFHVREGAPNMGYFYPQQGMRVGEGGSFLNYILYSQFAVCPEKLEIESFSHF